MELYFHTIVVVVVVVGVGRGEGGEGIPQPREGEGGVAAPHGVGGRGVREDVQAETQVLPVQDHLSLLCSQFLLSNLRPTHPSHSIITSPSGHRSMKQTLQSRFLPSVSHLLTNGRTDPATYRASLADLHTSAVQAAISQLEKDPVLQAPPPLLTLF